MDRTNFSKKQKKNITNNRNKYTKIYGTALNIEFNNRHLQRATLFRVFFTCFILFVTQPMFQKAWIVIQQQQKNSWNYLKQGQLNDYASNFIGPLKWKSTLESIVIIWFILLQFPFINLLNYSIFTIRLIFCGCLLFELNFNTHTHTHTHTECTWNRSFEYENWKQVHIVLNYLTMWLNRYWILNKYCDQIVPMGFKYKMRSLWE